MPPAIASTTPLGGGAQYAQSYLRVDYEALGSHDQVYAFQTPLATNHLFQGWADQFLVTPTVGLHDVFFGAGTRYDQLQLISEYHWYDAADGNRDFGQEFDLGVAYAFGTRLLAKIEYAAYRAGDAGTGRVDVDKIWLTLSFNY